MFSGAKCSNVWLPIFLSQATYPYSFSSLIFARHPNHCLFYFTNHKIVQPTDSSFSEHQLLLGLSNADPDTLKFIFTDLRPSVVKSVQALGGSPADGNVFFQTALMDTAQMARSTQFPEDAAVKEVLIELAKQHYSDWTKRNTPSEPSPEIPTEDLDAEPLAPAWMPSDDALKATRQHIYVWKTLNKLSSGCKATLLELPIEEETTCKTELAIALSKGSTNPDPTLPGYALDALRRRQDYQIWTTIRKYEEYTEKGLTLDGKAPKTDNTVLKYAFLTLLFMTLGYGLYSYFNRPKPAGEIFNQNFAPPQSLMTDMNRRFENDTSGIEKPERCADIFRDADAFYGQKNYSAAADVLLQMVDNDELSPCHADAFFALGIISLKREEPGDALQYMAKIDNIEAYGEDLYWYQALAFVQMAKRSSSYRTVARGAMERFLENTRNEERRQQGETMLKELQ